MPRSLSSTPARASMLALGALAVGLTAVCAQRAYAAVTVPNHAQITLVAAAGGVSGQVGYPEFNSPIKIAMSCLTGRRGTASIHATLHTASAAGVAAVSWSGTHAIPGAAPTAGLTATLGQDLVGVDVGNTVRLEVGTAVNFLRIQNANPTPATVILEQIW